MQLTIMATESLVTVDGNTVEMDLADYDILDAVHAVQFDGVEGEIEWQDPIRPNDVILTLDDFQQVIADHATLWAELQVDTRSEEQRRADALISIDHFAGQVRAQLLGPGEFMHEERRRAYEVAIAYEVDGFPGPTPLAVQVQMDTSGQTAVEAVAEIKFQHSVWLEALDQIRDLRLRGKAQILELAEGSDYGAQAQQTIDELAALAIS
ncbi:hypothetical protein Misp06_01330 [Microbulbifer sp. NBRC 101763]|uniref:hypothetical protein n=1 Tax=Microbulbifer TaxID=48073 RepID=UPI0003717073|nr:hypothetical protein [Microbulbifer variabilis]